MTVFAGVVLCGVAACSTGSESGQDLHAIKDSAGVTISETARATATGRLDWIVDDEPDLVLGEGDSLDEVLTRVQGLWGLPDGGILVVDGGSAQLRLYDASGERVGTAGGEGQGPGEFLDPVLVRTPGQEDVLLFDKRIARYQSFGPDGSFIRSIPHRGGWPQGRRPPLGMVQARALFRSLDQLPTGPSGASVQRLAFNYYWFADDSDDRTPFVSFENDLLFVDEGGTGPIPLTAAPSAAVTTGGAVATGAVTPEIREFDVSGKLARIFRLGGQRRAVTAEMVERAIDLRVATVPWVPRSEIAKRFDAMSVPDTLPEFASLLVDATGNIWAELYNWDPERPTDWVVFEPDRGEALGAVSIPPGLQLEYVGDGFVLGIWRDEFGVEYVRRHRLGRGRPGNGDGSGETSGSEER